ncbi:MAG: hypothetical protein ACKV2T_41580 [Kofleriaceae bacterium]
MRSGLLLLLVSTAACTPNVLDPDDDVVPAPASVRERLEDRTRLLVSRDTSTGSITAEKKNGDAWDTGTISLPYENGEIEFSSDASDALTIEGLQINFADIALPDSLFGGRPATLTHLRVELADAVRANATWSGDNDVALVAELSLELHWAIDINGSATQLGSPKFPNVPVGIRLVGDGDRVDASLSAYVEGELWSWAGLLKLRELELGVEASLAPPL